MGIKLADCYNTHQFRKLAKARLPGPIFHYIDGAADDEVTYRRNTAAYESCDLVPNVLAGVDTVDLSTTVMGIPIDMPLFLSPTALQRLFHHDGERAVGRADRPRPAAALAGCPTVSPTTTTPVTKPVSDAATLQMLGVGRHGDRRRT